MEERRKELKWIDVPRDKNGYTVSYSVSDLLRDREENARGPLAFFDTFGFVVIRNVLSEREIEDTQDEFFTHIEKESKGKFDRNSVKTWNMWKSRSFGMAGTKAWFGKNALKNRQNANVHAAFACILNEKNLLVNHDRWAMYRPTKVFPELKTRDNIHLDMNPRLYVKDEKNVVRERLRTLSYSDTRDLGPGENNNVTNKMGLAVQGVLNICDNREEDGGLQLIPGSHDKSRFEKWARGLKIPDESASFAIQPHDKVNSLAQRITMRAGSLAIWNQCCLHGSKHNQSDRPRLVQFIRMFPRRWIECSKRARNRANCVFQNLPAKFLETELSSIGKIVFGISDLDSTTRKKICDRRILVVPTTVSRRKKKVRLIIGDLLKSSEQYIVHQTNCRYKPPGVGLAKHIFKKFPHSDVYTCRSPWKPGTEYDKPGSIAIRGGGTSGLRGVVNLFGQNFQSKKEKNVKTFEESRALRLKWFRNGLEKIRSELPDLKSIAFPFQIGCGLAGGDWTVYLNEIERFASSFDGDVDVVVYKLPDDSEKAFKKDVENDKKKSRGHGSSSRRRRGGGRCGRVQGAWGRKSKLT